MQLKLSSITKNRTATAIKFNHREYKARVLNIEGVGFVNICSDALNRLLLTFEGDYVSDEAKFVDQQIFYFVNPVYFKLSNKALGARILKEMY